VVSKYCLFGLLLILSSLAWAQFPQPRSPDLKCGVEARKIEDIFKEEFQCPRNEDSYFSKTDWIPTNRTFKNFEYASFASLQLEAEKIWVRMKACVGDSAPKARALVRSGIKKCEKGKLAVDLARYRDSVLAFAESNELIDRNINWIPDEAEDSRVNARLPSPHPLFSHLLVHEVAKHFSMYQEWDWILAVTGAEIEKAEGRKDFMSQQFLESGYAGYRRLGWMLRYFSGLEPASCDEYGFFPQTTQLILLMVAHAHFIKGYGPNHAFGINIIFEKALKEGLSEYGFGWRAFLLPMEKVCGSIIPVRDQYRLYENQHNVFAREPNRVVKAVGNLDF
jgi:hypothetical protein